MPRLRDPRFAPDCTISFDGERIAARAGESVAAALLAAGRTIVARSSKYHRPRGPFCLAGSCHRCLARIDGLPSQRTCRTPCRDGLVVETQNAIGKAGHDLLHVIDVVYPRGLDHHHLMTWSRLANRAAVAFSRRLAGLGRLPDDVVPLLRDVSEEHVEALVVGAGPAGLAAAEAFSSAGRAALVVDEEAIPGGHLRCRLRLPGDPDATWPAAVVASVEKAGGEVALSTTAAGLWTDAGLCVLLLRRGAPPSVRLVRPRHVVLATGTRAQPPVFEDSDLPGVFAARGLLVALAECGIVPGGRAAVLGSGFEADAVAQRLAEAGVEVAAVGGEPRRARGRTRVSALELADGSEQRCDTVAVATPRAPAADLARLLGARMALDAASGVFRVAGCEDGRVAPGVWLAGEVLDAIGASAAAESGRQAAARALAEVRSG